MRVTTTKSKNAESFYITHSYTKNNGTTTSRIYKKLGTLAELSKLLNTDRDGVMPVSYTHLYFFSGNSSGFPVYRNLLGFCGNHRRGPDGCCGRYGRSASAGSRRCCIRCVFRRQDVPAFRYHQPGSHCSRLQAV